MPVRKRTDERRMSILPLLGPRLERLVTITGVYRSGAVTRQKETAKKPTPMRESTKIQAD